MGGRLLTLRRGDEAAGDADLLAACAQGDAAAFGVLFDRHHRPVYRFLARLSTTDPDALDDLVQTTFLTAWRSAGKFRGDSAVRTWLFGLALNTARHHARSAGRRRRLRLAWGARPEPAPAPSPVDRAAHRQQLDRLQQALAELPEPLREAFVLCRLEGVPGPEAAHLLGVPSGTLYRRLHEARQRLGAALAEDTP
ncbi:MAG: RNA polymerase sigma factor [Myxococcales bacterium]|nr:RNA polymerase sigma factor [Myxococcales bacterium]MCB9525299.1 RNA polymerase sigma factor [Myxococcales bacterium]